MYFYSINDNRDVFEYPLLPNGNPTKLFTSSSSSPPLTLSKDNDILFYSENAKLYKFVIADPEVDGTNPVVVAGNGGSISGLQDQITALQAAIGFPSALATDVDGNILMSSTTSRVLLYDIQVNTVSQVIGTGLSPTVADIQTNGPSLPIPCRTQKLSASPKSRNVFLSESFSAPSAYYYVSRHTFDPSVSISSSSSLVSETSSTPVTFTVTRAEGYTSVALAVNLAFSGTAVRDTDYSLSGSALTGNTITIAAGQTSASFTLTPIETVLDADVTFVVSAVDEEAYDLSENPPAFQVLTIANDPPTLSISVDKATLPEDSMTPATFTISRFIAGSSPLTFSITLSGSATLTSDFTLGSLSGSSPYSLTISANTLEATFTVQPVPDQLLGGSVETVTFTILPDAAGNSYVVVEGNDQATLSISNVGSATGDPHMIGFQGQRFDYIGENGQVVNMLSDPSLQVCLFFIFHLSSFIFSSFIL
jgi:hypothetical protein